MTLSRVIARLLLLLPLMPSPAPGADPDMTHASTLCDGKFGLCRYVDRRTGQEIIPARFEQAMPFSEGMAAVSIDGLFGYIDHRGEVVISPQFDLAGDFYQGWAEVVVGRKAGIINRKGEFVVAPMFRRAIPFTKDVILAGEGEWAPDPTFVRQELPRHGRYGSGKLGLYHVAGHWIRRPDLADIRPFGQEGMIWATEAEGSARAYGLLASDGRWIVEPQYASAQLLTDERAVVAKRVDGALLFGAVDPAGRLVVPLQPLQLLGWKNGWGSAWEIVPRGKYALVDKNGAHIGGRTFDWVEPPTEGDVAVVVIDGRQTGLDRSGRIVPHPRNGWVFASCPGGVRVIEMDGKIQITDANGQATVPYLFDPVNRELPCDRPYLVRLDRKWSFVAPDGRLLSDPPAFDEARDFDGGYAAVKRGEKWSFIDTAGRFVPLPAFDQYLGRRDGLFNVLIGGRRVWLTATGEERPEPAIKYTPSVGLLDCGHGLKLVESNGQWGIVDGDGKYIIAPSYRALSCFKNGVAWAPIESIRQWCPLGPDGALREKAACAPINYPYFATHSYPERFHDDPFENSVLWTRAFLEFGAGRREAPPEWVQWREGPYSVYRWQ
jgi:hypothetical protein